MGNETTDLPAKRGSRIPYHPRRPRALHKSVHDMKLKMDQVYLDNVKSTLQQMKATVLAESFILLSFSSSSVHSCDVYEY